MTYIEEYYNKIISKEIVVCKAIKTVYKHLVAELHNSNSAFYFDQNKADRAINFIENNCCVVVNNKLQLFKMELWQLALVSAVFGFVHKETQLRRFREVFFVVGRKNGKSALASAIALYMFYGDGELSARCYCVATTKRQARETWDNCIYMLKKSPKLEPWAKIRKSYGTANIEHTNSCLEVLASNSDNLDGLNVSFSLLDEVHAWKDKNLYNVVTQAMGARLQPLNLMISTAGVVRDGVYDWKYDQCKKILNEYEAGTDYIETILPVIYELDNKNEWQNEKNWIKPNPGLGTIKQISYIANQVIQAKKETKGSQAYKDLLTKDFNIMETASFAYFDFETLNNTAVFNIKQLKPRYAIGGVDLSQTTDLTCSTLLFRVNEQDPVIYVHQMYWLPESLIDLRSKEDGVNYRQYVEKGLMKLSAGNKIDHADVANWFVNIQQELDIYIYKIGYDKAYSDLFLHEIKNYLGQNICDEVRQGAMTLSNPLKNISADLENKLINYNNNPLLKICMANTKVVADNNGNIKPTKGKTRARIDGFASLLDAYTIYLRYNEDYLSII